jgi:hypothetical protein
MALPADRSTETHRVVAINPHDPVHQAIVGNPMGSNVEVKNGYLYFPKPGARGAESSPAAPQVKPESAPKPVVKKAAPKKEAAKPKESAPVQSFGDSLRAKEERKRKAIAETNARLAAARAKKEKK